MSVFNKFCFLCSLAIVQSLHCFASYLDSIGPTTTLIDPNWCITAYQDPAQVDASVNIRGWAAQVDAYVDLPVEQIRLMHLNYPVPGTYTNSVPRGNYTPQYIQSNMLTKDFFLLSVAPSTAKPNNGHNIADRAKSFGPRWTRSFPAYTPDGWYDVLTDINITGGNGGAIYQQLQIIANAWAGAVHDRQHIQVGSGYFKLKPNDLKAVESLVGIKSGILASRDQLAYNHPTVFFGPSLNQKINHEILRYSLGDQSRFRKLLAQNVVPPPNPPAVSYTVPQKPAPNPPPVRPPVQQQQNTNLIDKAIAVIYGTEIGDALGLPLETIPSSNSSKRQASPNSISRFLNQQERGSLNLGLRRSYGPGEGSDDTAQTLCLTQSLTSKRTFDATDFRGKLIAWYKYGYMAPNAVAAAGIGTHTREVMEQFIRHPNVAFADQIPNFNSTSSDGNGSVMRTAPCAIFYHKPQHLQNALDLARTQSRVTHPNVRAQDACALVTYVIHKALNGSTKDHFFANELAQFSAQTPEVRDLIRPNATWRSWGNNWSQFPTVMVGRVVPTVEVALACVNSSNNAREAVLKAINLSGDADTIGAITGAIAGAFWGTASFGPNLLPPNLKKVFRTKKWDFQQNRQVLADVDIEQMAKSLVQAAP
jgi:ADP-ribosyl-[dinitrogen reductase] hydrolase